MKKILIFIYSSSKFILDRSGNTLPKSDDIPSPFRRGERGVRFILPVSFLIFSLFFYSCNNKDQSKKNIGKDTTLDKIKPDSIKQETNLENNDTLYEITIVGDVMMGTNYPYPVLPPDDGKYIFDDVEEYLKDGDVTIGNLEGTLLNSGGTPKQCSDPAHCISFRMPEHYAEYLKNAGFNIMGVGNNHSGDMGEEGRTSTMNTLEKYGLKYAGYSRFPVTVFLKDGIRFGFTAFAPNSGTQNLNDLDRAIETITN